MLSCIGIELVRLYDGLHGFFSDIHFLIGIFSATDNFYCYYFLKYKLYCTEVVSIKWKKLLELV